MQTALKEYVDNVFRGAPDSETVNMLRIEVLSDLEQRYSEELSRGATPQQAYINAVSAMGDISGFIEQAIEADTRPVGFTDSSEQAVGFMQKHARLIADPKNIRTIKNAAVALLWVIAFGLAVFLDERLGWYDSWVLLVFTAAVNVGLNTAVKVITLGSKAVDSRSRIKILKKLRGGVSGVLWLTVFGMYALTNVFGLVIAGFMAQIILNAAFKIQINKYR